MNMDNQLLELEGLTIRITASNEAVTITWEGISEIEDPETELSPFLIRLIPAHKEQKVVIDFRTLEYMNSATLQPILQLIKELDAKAIDTEMRYDKAVEWQRITFRCLKAIASTLTHTRITSE